MEHTRKRASALCEELNSRTGTGVNLPFALGTELNAIVKTLTNFMTLSCPVETGLLVGSSSRCLNRELPRQFGISYATAWRLIRGIKRTTANRWDVLCQYTL